MHGIIGAGIGIWLFLTGLSGNAVPEYGQVIRQDAGQQPVIQHSKVRISQNRTGSRHRRQFRRNCCSPMILESWIGS